MVSPRRRGRKSKMCWDRTRPLRSIPSTTAKSKRFSAFWTARYGDCLPRPMLLYQARFQIWWRTNNASMAIPIHSCRTSPTREYAISSSRRTVIARSVIHFSPTESPLLHYIVTLLFKQPAHDLRVLCKQISASVLIGSASIAEIIRIFDVQNQKLIDLRLGQTCLLV